MTWGKMELGKLMCVNSDNQAPYLTVHCPPLLSKWDASLFGNTLPRELSL